jgi:hypothetical protein
MLKQSIVVACGAALGVFGLAVLIFFHGRPGLGRRPEARLDGSESEAPTLVERLDRRLAAVEQQLMEILARSSPEKPGEAIGIVEDTHVDLALEAMETRIADLEAHLEAHELKSEPNDDVPGFLRAVAGGGEPAQPDEALHALHDAVRRGDEDAVLSHIANGEDVNAVSDGWTPIRHAVEHDRQEVARRLIGLGADVNAQDPDGDTALGDAALFGNAAMARLLLEEGGADIAAKNKLGFTPLYRATMRGHRDVAELLLQHQAAVEARDNEGRTPLFTASEQGQTETVRLLLEWGADVNAADDGGRTPVAIATEAGHTETAEFLRQCGGY